MDQWGSWMWIPVDINVRWWCCIFTDFGRRPAQFDKCIEVEPICEIPWRLFEEFEDFVELFEKVEDKPASVFLEDESRKVPGQYFIPPMDICLFDEIRSSVSIDLRAIPAPFVNLIKAGQGFAVNESPPDSDISVHVILKLGIGVSWIGLAGWRPSQPHRTEARVDDLQGNSVKIGHYDAWGVTQDANGDQLETHA